MRSNEIRFITSSLVIGQNFVRVRYSPGVFFTPHAYKSRSDVPKFQEFRSNHGLDTSPTLKL